MHLLNLKSVRLALPISELIWGSQKNLGQFLVMSPLSIPPKSYMPTAYHTIYALGFASIFDWSYYSYRLRLRSINVTNKLVMPLISRNCILV